MRLSIEQDGACLIEVEYFLVPQLLFILAPLSSPISAIQTCEWRLSRQPGASIAPQNVAADKHVACSGTSFESCIPDPEIELVNTTRRADSVIFLSPFCCPCSRKNARTQM